MLKFALKKNATYRNRSCDGSEMARAISYTKGKINAYLIEPSPEFGDGKRRQKQSIKVQSFQTQQYPHNGRLTSSTNHKIETYSIKTKRRIRKATCPITNP